MRAAGPTLEMVPLQCWQAGAGSGWGCMCRLAPLNMALSTGCELLTNMEAGLQKGASQRARHGYMVFV